MNRKVKKTLEPKVMRDYSFLIDGGLRAGAKGYSEKEALETISRYWPRSSIELIGVDMPASKRGVVESSHRPASKAEVHKTRKRSKRAPVDKVTSMVEDTGMTEAEASLLAGMAG